MSMTSYLNPCCQQRWTETWLGSVAPRPNPPMLGNAISLTFPRRLIFTAYTTGQTKTCY